MGKLRLPALYTLISVLTGIASDSPHWVLLSVGLSLIVPPLTLLVMREGLTHALVATAVSLLILEAFNLKAPLNVLPLQACGALFYKWLERPSFALLAGSSALFLGALFQELLLGLPKEVEGQSLFITYRWGIYFLTSVLFSLTVYGITLLLLRKGYLFTKLKFGFWPVILFLISGFGTLLLKGEGKVIATNLLIGILSLFVAQGISVVIHFLGKLSPVARLIILILVVIFPLGFLTGALFIGFLDNWIDFRKLNGGKEDGSNSP
ncbi:hypothetical protein [Thermovibrio sp.]